MTIRPGEPWGRLAPPPNVVQRAVGDLAVGTLVADHRRLGVPLGPVAPLAGDLHRAVGGDMCVDRLSGGNDVAHLPCDVLRVVLDGDTVAWAVAHVVVRRPLAGSATLGWWRGRMLGFMNVQYLGRWDVAPRAHPNDGWMDVVEVAATMRPRARYEARRRLPLGTHVPHPSITTRRARTVTVDLAAGERVWIDGAVRPEDRVARLEVTVEPDAVTVVV